LQILWCLSLLQLAAAQSSHMRLPPLPLATILLLLFFTFPPAVPSPAPSSPSPPIWVQSLLLQRCSMLAFESRDLNTCSDCVKVRVPFMCREPPAAHVPAASPCSACASLGEFKALIHRHQQHHHHR
jgi:hypothetical protein